MEKSGRKILFSLLLCLWKLSILAQTGEHSLVNSYARVGAYSKIHADLFSATANQASLTNIRTLSAGMYSERKFLLAELSHYLILLSLPVGAGNLALKGEYVGSAAYNEMQWGLAYAKSLGDKFSAGIQFNYNTLTIPGYGKAAVPGIEGGILMHLSEKLHAGFHVSNPVAVKFGNAAAEKLNGIYTAGFGYDASEKFFLSMEIIKETSQPLNVNASIQYKIIPQLMFRAGLSSAVSSAWFGIGFSRKTLRVDLACGFHPQLGITPGLLVLFSRPLE